MCISVGYENWSETDLRNLRVSLVDAGYDVNGPTIQSIDNRLDNIEAAKDDEEALLDG